MKDILNENRRRLEALAADNDNASLLTDPGHVIDLERCRADFRYWAANAVKIRHKQTGRIVPFLLNRAQRRVLHRLEAMRLSGRPIRIIMLKARQWGGSTHILYSYI